MAQIPQREAVTRTKFDEFLKASPSAAASVKTDADREALFKQFQAWETERSARAQAPQRQNGSRRQRQGFNQDVNP
jgi:hypothetical protein